MNKVLQKVERIRERGLATLRLTRGHPMFLYNGNSFKVLAIHSPGYKCRLTLQIRNKPVEFGIDDVF